MAVAASVMGQLGVSGGSRTKGIAYGDIHEGFLVES